MMAGAPWRVLGAGDGSIAGQRKPGSREAIERRGQQQHDEIIGSGLRKWKVRPVTCPSTLSTNKTAKMTKMTKLGLPVGVGTEGRASRAGSQG